MRILYLSPLPLTRRNNGVKLRGISILDGLRQFATVDVLAFDEEGEPANCPLPSPPGHWERLLSPVPSLIRCFQSRRFAGLVRNAAPHYDVLWCLGLQMAQFQAAAPSALPVVLDSYNVESDILLRLASRRTGLKRAYWRLQAYKLARFERQALNRVQLTLAISSADAQRMAELSPGCRLVTLPPGMDLESYRMLQGKPVPGRLVFVGVLDWHVNIDASCWMAEQVLPLIRKVHPEATLEIVGRRPVPEVLALARRPGVRVYADVADVAVHLDSAAVVVAPVRFGSGVQQKVIEGLASGKPVVTTPLGLEGLDLRAGEHLLTGETAEQMACQCAELLACPERAAKIGAAGRAAVLETYATERLVRDLGALVASLQPAALRQTLT